MTGVRLRALLAGTALTTGLVAASSANALETKFGSVSVFFDTTVTVGASVRTAETEDKFLPEANGGPQDVNRALIGPGGAISGTGAFPGAAASAPGATFFPISAGNTNPVTGATQFDNFPGSINADDGRLNFDQWDLTSGIIKMTNDIQANWRNYTLFARVNSFYDAVLNNDTFYDRSDIDDGAKVDVGRDIDLLDLYLSGDFTVADLPVNLRAGKQVISWGESTFFLNGINTINPLDVNAFRRPGAEIKEGLLPVWALYGSIGLPFDLSLEAFYQLVWEEIKIDRPGTPFSTSDVARTGSELPGNVGGVAFTSGASFSGTFRRNCDGTLPAGLYSGGADVVAAIQATLPAGCTAADAGTAAIDFRTNLSTLGNEAEAVKLGLGTQDTIVRLQDENAKDQGQYGVALRWYSEALNSTEFGFYFVNYHSRLPFASQRTFGGGTLDLGSVTPNTSAIGRQTNTFGCANFNGTGALDPVLNTLLPVSDFTLPPGFGGTVGPGTSGLAGTSDATGAPVVSDAGVFLDPRLGNGLVDGTNLFDPTIAAVAATNGPGVLVVDPDGLLEQIDGLVDTIDLNLTTPGIQNGFTAAGVTAEALPNTFGKLVAVNCTLALAQAQIGTGQSPSAQGGLGAGTTAAPLFDGLVPLLSTGAELLSFNTSQGLFLEYPEDIHLWGVSFNTTVGDWGVQGEVSFRDNQPFQLDNDAITIAAAGANCAFLGIADIGGGFEGLINRDTLCIPATAATSQVISGVQREEMYTASVGTTATYTNSNPLVGFLGGDIGILVTEVSAIYVPDVPEEGDFSVPQFANVCRSGSDLPLGGLLSLDSRSACRPDSFSWGYTLLSRIDYNSAFGTAVTLSPQIAFSHDVKGNSPAPISSFREGGMSVALAVNGEYQNTWRGGISYVNNFGDEVYNTSTDTDFVAVNLSYSF